MTTTPVDTAPAVDGSKDKDPEGLSLHYDAIICGTGLVESILASALARAGKTVLHCDAETYYGGMDAVWTLPYLGQQCDKWQHGDEVGKDTSKADGPVKESPSPLSSAAAADDNSSSIALSPTRPVLTLRSKGKLTTHVLGKGSKVTTPYGKGTVQSISMPDGKAEIALSSWALADGTSPVLYVPFDNLSPSALSIEDQLSQHSRIDSVLLKNARHCLEEQSRTFALDISPSLLFASGTAVDAFLRSGVADYVEFQSLEGIYYLDTPKKANGNNGMTRVPCSKAEVFATKLLSPLEKRKLMKFLQLVMDYGIWLEQEEELKAYLASSQQEDSTTTIKDSDDDEEEKEAVDEETTQSSPDNAIDTDSAIPGVPSTEEGVMSHNERRLNQGRSLARPQNKAVSSKELQSLQQAIRKDQPLDFVTYLRDTQKLKGSLLHLVRHALALESSAAGAGSSLQDGMKRLVQHVRGLGRYGVTAFLAPLYGSGEFSQSFCRSAAVHGATYLLRRAPLKVVTTDPVSNTGSPEEVSNRLVKGVVIENDNDNGSVTQKTVRCHHVVVNSQHLPSSVPSSTTVLRRISVLSGRVVNETSFERHMIIVPPRDDLGSGAIHGLLLDRTTKVVPHGCTLLHLTCTVPCSDTETTTLAKYKDLLADTVQQILAGSSTDQEATVSVEKDTKEIYHVEFAYTIPQIPVVPVDNLHICHTASPSLIADDAFEKAKTIFDKICPNETFLGLSESMQKTIQEGFVQQEEEDEEREALDRAVETLLDEGKAEQDTNEEKDGA